MFLNNGIYVVVVKSYDPIKIYPYCQKKDTIKNDDRIVGQMFLGKPCIWRIYPATSKENSIIWRFGRSKKSLVDNYGLFGFCFYSDVEILSTTYEEYCELFALNPYEKYRQESIVTESNIWGRQAYKNIGRQRNINHNI